MATVPYTPVKGIWDEDKRDFLDHGQSRTQGRIYGVVLAEPNFAWEDQLDKDGVWRTYACVDVIIFTEIYPEAREIVGKSLSMELLPKSIKGSWQEMDGKKFFVFEEASFAGLQALGDDVEPCFEGAGFFSLLTQIQELNSYIQQYTTKGGKKVPNINFKLSDGQKYDLIWSALNPNYNEEGGWESDVSVCDVYDDYALCFKFEDRTYFRQYYSKSEEGPEGTIVLGDAVRTFVLDLTESEYNALNAFRTLNGGSFEKADENYSELKTKNEEFSTTLQQTQNELAGISEALNSAEETYKSMEADFENTKGELEVANASLASLQTEVESLKDYKHSVETSNKQKVIDKYAMKLDEEIVANYSARIDEFTEQDLEKELSYELVKATPSIFSAEGAPVIPKADIPLTGIEAILAKYK